MMEIEWKNGIGYTDASDLGFPPNKWPVSVVVKRPAGTSAAFIFEGTHRAHGEVDYADYRCGSLRLRVFND
jgi:hypothetical protein